MFRWVESRRGTAWSNRKRAVVSIDTRCDIRRFDTHYRTCVRDDEKVQPVGIQRQPVRRVPHRGRCRAFCKMQHRANMEFADVRRHNCRQALIGNTNRDRMWRGSFMLPREELFNWRARLRVSTAMLFLEKRIRFSYIGAKYLNIHLVFNKYW